MIQACHTILTRLFLCTVLLSTSGCVSHTSPTEFQQLKKLSHQICQIAVLPFFNDTEYTQGGIIFYRIFLSQLNKSGDFDVVQEGDVRKIYRQMKINPKQTPTLEQTLILADHLNLQAVVVGKVVLMEEQKGSLQTEPKLAVDLKLLDATTGNIILTSYLNKSGEDFRKVMHFGLVNNITELAKLVSDEILDTWRENGVTGCD